ncbi:hypothetical protein LUZ60_000521 [Juncus effusus]|nr:hypothetical protein LUZ60_000521 [Juncus effusus]
MPFCTYTYEELLSSTNGFSPNNRLGEGGSGVVYKGVLDKTEVAVKKLKIGSRKGDLEFKSEIETISRVHHKNLVSLVGYCVPMSERLLVFEFLPNKTLDIHLHGQKVEQSLNWQQRRKIALGSAKGLAYLHEDCDPKIIHRDIKTSNILLDVNFEPKVADFGLAKLKSSNQAHVSTRIMGTFGYVDPDFYASGKLTEKADVYAFGVVLLELITGRPPVWSTPYNGKESLVTWARPLLARALEEGNYEELVDPKLGTDYDSYEMRCMIECATSAVNYSAHHRPLMSQIVQKLKGDTVDLNLNDVTITELSMFSSFNSFNYINPESSEIARMRQGSRGYASSEFSDQLSSQNPFMSTTNIEPLAR